MDWTPYLESGFIIRAVVAVAGGLVTGFVGGMVGLALGRPRLLLVYWAARNPVDAAGTNILVSSLAAATGTWIHLREQRIDFAVLALMGIPSFLGAFIGGFFGGRVPAAILLVIVGITTTWYGYTLIKGRRGQRRGGDNPGSPTSQDPPVSTKSAVVGIPVRRRLLEIGLGFVIGLFGGLVGLVLGQLRLPAMIHAMGMDVRMAAGTNLAIGFFTGLFGFAGHLLRLEVDWPVLIILGSTSMLGSHLGARQTGKVSLRTLTRWMGIVMVITSLPIFWLAYTQRAALPFF
ncbi:MAG TPA: sulfite exporter TauE/SafE family protein [Dehalococcoidia bacterium]|nr:sulfite exporter TauE/SafE family protein [Dehalococcoidia bacterium]